MSIKSSPSYKQGYRDADILVKTDLSVWAVCHIGQSWGFRRKDKKGSHKKLYRYCEGFCDRIEVYAKSKKIKIVYNQWNAGAPSQEDIGKEIK